MLSSSLCVTCGKYCSHVHCSPSAACCKHLLLYWPQVACNVRQQVPSEGSHILILVTVTGRNTFI